MSAAPGTHDANDVERVFLYAVHALPPSEIPLAEAHLAACADCRHELEALRPVVDAFVSWPTDVLRPAPSLWERLEQRIATEHGRRPTGPPSPGWALPEWEAVAPGIECKLLATDTETGRVSMLVRLAPGTEYPPHRHAGVEELHLLHGELMIGDRRLYPGDYNRAEAGTVDRRVWSDTGCTCVLLTSVHDVIL
jgi:anti-sigma factor ChrR (cupin superfamily)